MTITSFVSCYAPHVPQHVAVNENIHAYSGSLFNNNETVRGAGVEGVGKGMVENFAIWEYV